MESIVIILLVIAFIFLIVALTIWILFNLTMQKAMKAVSEKNRKINPGLIWLNIIPIPILNPLWTGYFCIATCQSINEDAKKKIAPLQIAIAYIAVTVLNGVINIFTVDYSHIVRSFSNGNSMEQWSTSSSNPVGSILSLASLVLFIIFWVQIVAARKKLEAMEGSGGASNADDILDAGI